MVFLCCFFFLVLTVRCLYLCCGTDICGAAAFVQCNKNAVLFPRKKKKLFAVLKKRWTVGMFSKCTSSFVFVFPKKKEALMSCRYGNGSVRRKEGPRESSSNPFLNPCANPGGVVPVLRGALRERRGFRSGGAHFPTSWK